jgi:spore germination protein YaaH
MDYVRYRGDAPDHRSHGHDPTMEVTGFVKRVRDELIDSINPKLYLSAALMPPCEDAVKWYGQDYGQLAQYLDFMVPMIYKYSYNGDCKWVATLTANAVSKANGIPIVVGLQNYDPDADYQLLSSAELKNDINTVITCGAAGFVVFRYTPGKYINYKWPQLTKRFAIVNG